MNYIFLLIGFVLLVKGADYFVDGASEIARSLKIPTLIIGLTIVAFGTSAPEAAVSISASLDGQNGMAMGNVIGSNLFNLLMVVGLTGIIKTLHVEKSIVKKEFPFLLLSSLLMFVLIGDVVFQGSSANVLTRGDGLVLLMFFAIFMYSLITSALDSRNDSLGEISVTYECPDNGDILVEGASKPLGKSILISIIGVIAIVLGGQLVVKCASAIASQFGVSDQIIGLTVVAIGTSLPELVTSLVAATKGESDIALGNVIGSNVFNILFILGISSVISPMSIDTKLLIDSLFMIFATILTYVFSASKKEVNKFESISLVLLYIVYTAYLIISI